LEKRMRDERRKSYENCEISLVAFDRHARAQDWLKDAKERLGKTEIALLHKKETFFQGDLDTYVFVCLCVHGVFIRRSVCIRLYVRVCVYIDPALVLCS
jgi:hypothetical protein